MLDNNENKVTTNDFCEVVNPQKKEHTVASFDINRMEQLLEDQELSWGELEDLIDENYVYEIMSKTPKKHIAEKIADLFQVNINWLYGANVPMYLDDTSDNDHSNMIFVKIDRERLENRIDKIGWGRMALYAFCNVNTGIVSKSGTVNKISFNNLLYCLRCSKEYLAGESFEYGHYPDYIENPKFNPKKYFIRKEDWGIINTYVPVFISKLISRGTPICKRMRIYLDNILQGTHKTCIPRLSGVYSAAATVNDDEDLDDEIYCMDKDRSLVDMLDDLTQLSSKIKALYIGERLDLDPRLQEICSKLMALDEASRNNILNVIEMMLVNVGGNNSTD